MIGFRISEVTGLLENSWKSFFNEFESQGILTQLKINNDFAVAFG